VADIQMNNFAALPLQGFGGVNYIANGVVKVGGTFRWKDHAGHYSLKSQNRTWAQSVPPRGSGWVRRRRARIKRLRTHPLPRGGTDCVQVRFVSLECVAEIVYQVVDILDSNRDPHEIRRWSKPSS